jgi:hypothetical protein
MKKIFYLFLIATITFSCNNSEKKNSENPDENTEVSAQGGSVVDVRMPVYRGEFIFTDEAAVLKGKNFVYGVVIDTVARELAARVAPIKKDEFDMVPVVVTGIVSPNPALSEGKEGWEEVITIKNILNVSAKPAEADVKIEDNN